MRLAIGNDHLGQPDAYLGQPAELGWGCQVHVDPLGGAKRPPLPQGTITLGVRRSRWQRAQKLNLTGRLAWASEEMPDTLAEHCQSKEQQHGASFGCGHGGTVQRRGGSLRTSLAQSGAYKGGKNGILVSTLPPDQFHRHIAHHLQARGADLVNRIVLGVPGGIIKVNHVDGSNAGFLQLQMVVDERVPG